MRTSLIIWRLLFLAFSRNFSKFIWKYFGWQKSKQKLSNFAENSRNSLDKNVFHESYIISWRESWRHRRAQVSHEVDSKAWIEYTHVSYHYWLRIVVDWYSPTRQDQSLQAKSVSKRGTVTHVKVFCKQKCIEFQPNDEANAAIASGRVFDVMSRVSRA